MNCRLQICDRWVENPLHVDLQEMIGDPPLIPIFDGFTQLLESTYKVSSVVWFYLGGWIYGAGIAERVSALAIASLCGNHCVAGFEPRLVSLIKALYHTSFICGQRCKCWYRRPKLTSSVISDVKPIIYIFLKIPPRNEPQQRVDKWISIKSEQLPNGRPWWQER